MLNEKEMTTMNDEICDLIAAFQERKFDGMSCCIVFIGHAVTGAQTFKLSKEMFLKLVDITWEREAS